MKPCSEIIIEHSCSNQDALIEVSHEFNGVEYDGEKYYKIYVHCSKRERKII